MRLPLRNFLIICLAFGAIGIPWAWRSYQKSRIAELQRLQGELNEAYLQQYWTAVDVNEGKSAHLKNAELTRRIESLRDRIKGLTGSRPSGPTIPIPVDPAAPGGG